MRAVVATAPEHSEHYQIVDDADRAAQSILDSRENMADNDYTTHDPEALRERLDEVGINRAAGISFCSCDQTEPKCSTREDSHASLGCTSSRRLKELGLAEPRYRNCTRAQIAHARWPRKGRTAVVYPKACGIAAALGRSSSASSRRLIGGYGRVCRSRNT
jgi:hypothetical protein